jgi:O-antigen ligase
MFGIFRLSRPQQVHVFYSFALGMVVASLICLVRAFTSYLETGDWSVFFYSRFTQIIDSHPTYFAYYLIFAITYGLYSLYYDLPKKFTTWGILLILFFFVILLLTGGQTSFISLLLTFSFFVSKYLLDQKTKRTSMVAMLVLSLSIGWFGLTFLFQNSDLFRSISDQNDYWERMSLWESAIRANSNPWFGVGTGDYNLILNEYYRSHDMANFASENMNAHNEFIQMYFSNGLVGLVALLLILSRPLYLAVRYQNLLAILLYFPFIVYGITEVFLGRYQGVVFLSFVHQLFVSHSLASKPMTIANIS